jgi:protein pelota
VRKVVQESLNGSTSTSRVHVNLLIKVLSTDFDAQSSQLHVSGRVAEPNKYVAMGQHHTLDLELNRQFTLSKNDGWDSVAIDMLKEALDTSSRAELWAVVMQEGLANICYITAHQTVLVQRVAANIPKKRAQSSDYDKATAKFHQTLLDTLLRHLDLLNQSDPKPLLLASPGFLAQSFYQYMKTIAAEGNNKALAALLPMVTVTHSSNAHLSSLAEVLKSPSVMTKLRNSRFARETQLLDQFYESLRKDDGRAWYGPNEVEKCVDKGAVGRGGGVLLISNDLFRAKDVRVRKRWVALVDRVREEEGGEVRVLSSAHESGKRLEALGGVACILTFPILDLDEEGEAEMEGG